jgi:hypothetical protein
LITRDGFKYIFNPVDEDEVYDLNTDPGEMHNLMDDEGFQGLVQDLRQRLIRTSAQVGDPVRDYIAKLFGDWKTLSDQPDASTPKLAQALDLNGRDN